MNVRSAGDHLTLGNRISSLFVDLPVDEADALAAYKAVKRATTTLKRS